MNRRHVPILLLLAAALLASPPDHIRTLESATALTSLSYVADAGRDRTGPCSVCDSNAVHMAWNEYAQPFPMDQLVDGSDCYELSGGNQKGWEDCSGGIGSFSGPSPSDWEPEPCTLWGTSELTCWGDCDWLPCGTSEQEVPVESATIAADGGLASARFQTALASMHSAALETERACSGAILHRVYTPIEVKRLAASRAAWTL